MTEQRNEARDAGILAFGRVMAMAADALMPFIIVRLLGKADVGAFSALLLIYETLAVFLTAGLPGSVLYFLANRTVEQRTAVARRMFKTVQVLGVGVAGAMLLLGAIGDETLLALGAGMSGDHSGANRDVSHLTAFALFPIFDVTQRIFPSYCIAVGHAKGAAIFGVLRAIGKSAATLIPASLGFGVLGIIVGMTIYGVLQAAAIALYVRRRHRGIPREEPLVSVREMIRFSLPLGLTEVIGFANAAVDRYTIIFFMSAARFAEYRSGAWQIPVKAFPYAVGQAYMPRFVTLIQEKKGAEVIALWRTATHKISLAVVPICMVFLVGSDEFIRVAFTDAYLAAAPVFAWYTVYTMGRVAAFGPLILAAGRSDLIFRASVFTLMSNVVITIPLTMAIGFVGPAIGTAIAFIPTVAVYCRYIAIALDVPFSKTFPLMDWLKVVLVAGIAAGPALAIKFLWGPPPLLALPLYLVTIAPLYVLIARATGLMSGEDLRFAFAWLPKPGFMRRR